MHKVTKDNNFKPIFTHTSSILKLFQQFLLNSNVIDSFPYKGPTFLSFLPPSLFLFLPPHSICRERSNPSHSCNLHPHLWQSPILNLLCRDRNWTCVPVVQRHHQTHCTTAGAPRGTSFWLIIHRAESSCYTPFFKIYSKMFIF